MVHAMAHVDLQRQRMSLPIYPARDALLKNMRANGCCVVVGETGSGKTTQIPQYLLEAGFTKKGAVAVTQPRRVAAISIAKRVASERGVQLGQEVGYSVRFEDCSSPHTKVRYMTDGMLLREAISDPLLMRYSVVILDEAHERTVHTDILFGVVKAAQKKRVEQGCRKMRIVIMSATLTAEAFSNYFNSAKVLYIQGRQFPVQIYYTVTPQTDYVNSAVISVLQLHEEQEAGDILVFLTGREEIESMQSILAQCRELFPSSWNDILVCPLYAALPTGQQQKVFVETPKDVRKIILSTNIAETSITIPGVKYVLDTGMVKARGYNPHIGLDLLCIQPVSKAQARQRAGRAGREMAGFCYRLYTEDAFEALPNDTIPEIQRCPLSSVVLQLLALGISNILDFDFMDPPSEESLLKALEQLYLLRAVEKDSKEEDKLRLTPLGKRMAYFPLEPNLSKAIIVSQDHGCTEEVVTIVSMLSVDSVLFTPRDKQEEASAARKKFVSSDGDHITLLQMYRGYKSAKGNKAWCKENFIHIRNMHKVMDVRKQLLELCARVGVVVNSFSGRECSEQVRKALLGGLFTNVAEHTGEGKYRTLSTRQEVFIHPSSCLFHNCPQSHCVVYSELIHTTKCYMRNVSEIDPNWLLFVAPTYFRRRQ